MSSSARRALRILEVVGRAEQPLGVSEIARRLDLPAGTAFRGLDALQRASYVDRYQSSSRYVLGSAALSLHRGVLAQFKIRDAALPYLRQLASSSGETVSLIVSIGWYGVRIASARGSNEVTNAPALGLVGPLADSYLGRPLLAFQGRAAIARYAAWAKIEKPQALAADMTTLRRNGYDVERDDGSNAAIALPLRHAEQALAVLAIEGPALDGAAAARVLPTPWSEVVRAMEIVIAARPQLFENPYGHLDPDKIVLNGN